MRSPTLGAVSAIIARTATTASGKFWKRPEVIWMHFSREICDLTLGMCSSPESANYFNVGPNRSKKGCGVMPYNKTIVCLANSYKPPNGRCIAGREVIANGYGGWIRPVSDRETAEVSLSEYRYENNQSPQVLHIIEIPLLRPQPVHHQTENHVIDATRRWTKKGQLAWIMLETLRDRPASLWINSDSTTTGTFDRISQAEAATVHDSLVLVKPEDFAVEVGRNYWTGRNSFRGTFRYNGTYHNLSITDPVVRDVFGKKEQGHYPLNDVYLCISLTEPFEHDDKCHKLVAAVICQQTLG
jgi:hypothetical protein